MSETRDTTETSDLPKSYRRLVWIYLGLGVVCFIGGVLWLIGGAGIFGSPVSGAFSVDELTGYANYWAFWMMWVVVAGPIALLPCMILEWWRPRVGAVALMGAALFVSEAGIRASRMYWGFSDEDALIVIGCIATPMYLIAASLLIGSFSKTGTRRVVVAGLVILTILFGGAIAARFNVVKAYWRANCPAALEVQ